MRSRAGQKAANGFAFARYVYLSGLSAVDINDTKWIIDQDHLAERGLANSAIFDGGLPLGKEDVAELCRNQQGYISGKALAGENPGALRGTVVFRKSKF